MRKVNLGNAGESVADYARSARNDPVVFVEHGKPVAALISLENVDWETVALGTSAEFMQMINEAREQIRKEGGIPHDDVLKMYDVRGCAE